MKFRKERRFFVILCGSLFLSLSLEAQFSGYIQADSTAYNAALFSNGAGLRDPMSNLGGNPAFLISHGKHITEAGGATVSAQKAVGPILLNGGGFYTLNPNFGIGIRLKPVYTKFFPADERLVNYTGQALFSYKLNEIIYLGIGLGPSVSNRPGGYSSYSWNAFASVGIIYQSLSLGLILESPGANSFNNYLGSDTLKEKYPEKISIGVQYHMFDVFFLYGEFVRTFWERAVFSQNGLEEIPPFPIKTSYTGSMGVGLRISSQLDFLMGVSQLAQPTEKGSLDPIQGVSVGIKGEILPSVFGSGVFGSLYLQRIGIRKTIEPFEAETRFGFQIQVLYDAQKEDIILPNK